MLILICNCDIAEATVYYILHCPNISNERLSLFKKTLNYWLEYFNYAKFQLVDHLFIDFQNASILFATIKYIIKQKVFIPHYIKIGN